MADKTYKAIFVPEDLHYKIKKEALKRKISMIEFLENMLVKITLLDTVSDKFNLKNNVKQLQPKKE